MLSAKVSTVGHCSRLLICFSLRVLYAVATGRFLFCLYREKYLHISFWRAFSLYLTSAADLNSLVLLPGGLLDAILALRLLAELHRNFNRQLDVAYIDIK